MASPSETLQAKYGYFHGNSKFLTRESYTSTYSSIYKHGHIVLINEILSDILPYCLTSAEVDAWIIENPGILKKYTQYPLTALGLSSNETWYIKDTELGGKWMKPMVLPELVPNSISNARASGYLPTLYKEDGSLISSSDGLWWYDPYQGSVRFGDTYNPGDMTPSWGTPKITCYIYIGKTLDQYLEEIKPITFKYSSSSPLTLHEISHGLDSMDLDISVRVKDPETNIWANDNVGIEYVDSNNIKIHLTEASDIVTLINVVR